MNGKKLRVGLIRAARVTSLSFSVSQKAFEENKVFAVHWRILLGSRRAAVGSIHAFFLSGKKPKFSQTVITKHGLPETSSSLLWLLQDISMPLTQRL